MPEIIHIRYCDVGEQGPRLGCGQKTEHRAVIDITPAEGGEMGIVRYKGKYVQVYRRTGLSKIWTTDQSELGPLKVTKVF
jgi:hypothetical protein